MSVNLIIRFYHRLILYIYAGTLWFYAEYPSGISFQDLLQNPAYIAFSGPQGAWHAAGKGHLYGSPGRQSSAAQARFLRRDYAVQPR